MYESQIARNPGTLMALLKPLLRHQPLQMMTCSKDMLNPESLASAAARAELEKILRILQATDELSLDLLNHLQSWRALCIEQRNDMMTFFESSRLLCSVTCVTMCDWFCHVLLTPSYLAMMSGKDGK